MKWFVGTGLVRIPDDVMGTRHDTARTSGAEARRDDFAVELFPLVCPTRLLAIRRRGGFTVDVRF